MIGIEAGSAPPLPELPDRSMNERLRLHSEPVAAPEELGLATAGLDRLSSVMQREVESGHVPGISMLIARHGKIGYRQIFGALRPGGPPMPGGPPIPGIRAWPLANGRNRPKAVVRGRQNSRIMTKLLAFRKSGT